ncbi:MAG TPA: hypothetical protein VGM06_05745 [Polyangiaceae bacterium]|jgi:hypothetical protein
MLKQDYIERMIALLADAIGRIVGLAQSGRHEEAQREIDAAWSGIIGLRRADLQRLDDETLRALVGPKSEAAVRLLDAEASVREAAGDLATATRLRHVAASLKTTPRS